MIDQPRPLRVAAQRIKGKVERLAYGERYMEKKFTKYYASNFWHDAQSLSGPGSNLEQTAVIRKQLPSLFESYGIRTVLDIPCGDFSWMKEVPLIISQYIGADIVDDLVNTNNAQYADRCRSFTKLDAVKDDLPCVDLILSRDCFVHFSVNDIMAALRNFQRSGSSYLLTTTFTDRKHNISIETGGWRPINLEAPPFNLPPPTQIVNEQCTQHGGRYRDKSLALWKLENIAV
jgi:SAM-dependent methyltransferase